MLGGYGRTATNGHPPRRLRKIVAVNLAVQGRRVAAYPQRDDRSSGNGHREDTCEALRSASQLTRQVPARCGRISWWRPTHRVRSASTSAGAARGTGGGGRGSRPGQRLPLTAAWALAQRGGYTRIPRDGRGPVIPLEPPQGGQKVCPGSNPAPPGTDAEDRRCGPVASASKPRCPLGVPPRSDLRDRSCPVASDSASTPPSVSAESMAAATIMVLPDRCQLRSRASPSPEKGMVHASFLGLRSRCNPRRSPAAAARPRVLVPAASDRYRLPWGSRAPRRARATAWSGQAPEAPRGSRVRSSSRLPAVGDRGSGAAVRPWGRPRPRGRSDTTSPGRRDPELEEL